MSGVDTAPGSDSVSHSRPVWTARVRNTVVGRGAVIPLAAAHGLAAAGDAFVSVSLAGSLFFNVSPDASREQILLYLLVTMAPLAVLSPLVGPAVDRFRRSQRYVAATFYVARGLLCLALAMTLLQLAFYPIVLGVLILSKASGVVKQTLVQTLVDDPDELVATNARLARFATVTASIGVGVASGVFAALGPEWSLRSAAILLAMSGAFVLRCRPHRAPESADEEVEYVETHRPLVVISSIGVLAIRAAVGFFIFTLAFTLRRTSEPAFVYGIGAAFYGAGAFAGHSAAPVLRRWFREERLIALAIALPAAFSMVGILGASVPLLMVLSGLVGLSTTLGRHAFDALLQRRAPAALLGRAGARYETQFQLAWVFGGVVATPISLPAEISMMVLTAIYVPALVVILRGGTAAHRHEDHATEPMELARSRLSDARQAWAAGARKVAIVEASAAADLALSQVRADVDVAAQHELDDLRRIAIEADVVNDGHVARAIQLADRVVSASAPR